MILPTAVLLTTVLAAVLLVSGAAKLGRSGQTLRMLTHLRLPQALRRRGFARALPDAELALGAALLLVSGPTFAVVAAASVALFGAFLAVTLVVLMRRQTVLCACFGGTSARPIDRWTVARNLVFLLSSLVVLVFADDGVVAGMLAFDAAEWIAYGSGVLALAASIALALAVRSAGSAAPVLAGRDGEPWPVPDVEVTSEAGRAVELASIPASRPTLLLLLSAHCAPCGSIAERIPQWTRELQGVVDIAVLTSDSPEALRRAHPTLDVPLYYGYRALMSAARIGGAPSAFLLAPDRMVAAGPAQGKVEVEELVRAIVSVIPASTRRRADAAILPERMEIP